MIPPRAAAGMLLAALLALALLAPSGAAAYELSDTPPAHRMAMTLALGPRSFVSLDGVAVTFDGEAARALAAWNEVGVGPLLDHDFFSATRAAIPARCDPEGVNVVGFAATNCGLSWGDAVAVTSLWVTAGRVVQADVIFKQNERWDSYSGPLRTQLGAVVYDFYRVALHEFGHIAGLDHVPDSTESIMRARVTDIDQLQADDVAGVRAVAYSPFGDAPLIAVAPSTRDFGKVRAGGFFDGVFTVQNLGGAPLAGQVSTAPPFACVAGCQYTLPIGATAAVTIRFAPPALGLFQGAVAFSGAQGAAIAVSGVGVADGRVAFIGDLYGNLLARPPSEAEAADWLAYLVAHPDAAGAGAVIHALFDGPEYRGRPVTPWTHAYLLFVSILGRAPGSGELGAWTNDLIGRLNALLPLFVGSQEFRNLVPSLDDPGAAATVVARLYGAALGRAPSDPEGTAWRDYLVATGDMEGFARAIFGSVEHLVVPRTLAQRVEATFRGVLGREPLAAEVVFFADAIAAQVIPIEDVFIASPESQARFQALFQ